MSAAGPGRSPQPRCAPPRARLWTRLAAVAACIALVALLNRFDDCAGYGGLVESAGWPLTFLVYDGNTGTTRIVAHGLVLNLLAWAGIVFGVWFAAGKRAGKRNLSAAAGKPTAAPPDADAQAGRGP